MWLSVCVLTGLKQPMPELIVHVDSLDIFPVSWCETNGYPLVYPIKPSGIHHDSSSHHFVVAVVTQQLEWPRYLSADEHNVICVLCWH